MIDSKGKFWSPPAMWQGETVFIIGGGPSLKREPLYPDFAPLHSRRVIGVNDAYTLGKWVDVCFFGDTEWYARHNRARPGLKEFGGLIVSNNDATRKESDVLTTMRRVNGFHVEQGYVGWNLNSGAAAINLAAYFGAKRIVLIGFDLKLAEDGRGNWYPNALDPKKMKFDKFIKGFKALKEGMDKHRPDIEVLNTSLDSALDIWPKVSLEEVLKTESELPRPPPPPEAIQFKSVQPSPSASSIPKTFHFFWIGGKLPDYAEFLMAKWQELNPEYEIKLHGEEVLRPEYLPIYNMLRTPSQKVDVLKWCALQTEGGWIIDADTVPLHPFSMFTDKIDTTAKFVAINVPPADEKPGMERCDMGLIGATTDSRIWAAVNWWMAGNVDMTRWERRGTKGGACVMEWLLETVPHLMTRFPANVYCPYGCKRVDIPWMEKGRLFYRAYRAGEDVTAMVAEYNAAFGTPPDDVPMAWHIWNRAIE